MKAGELLGEHKKMKDKVKRLEKEVKHLEKHKNHHSLVSCSVCFVPCNEPDDEKKRHSYQARTRPHFAGEI